MPVPGVIQSNLRELKVDMTANFIFQALQTLTCPLSLSNCQ